jgi:hypothetical protein
MGLELGRMKKQPVPESPSFAPVVTTRVFPLEFAVGTDLEIKSSWEFD